MNVPEPATSPVKDTVTALDKAPAVVAVAALPVVSALIVAGKLIVTVPALSKTVTSFAVPAKVNVPPKSIADVLGTVSLSDTVMLELVNEALAILDNVFEEPLIVLLVKVCVPVSVATVLSIAIVTVLVAADVSIPVPPATVKISLSNLLR